MSFRRNLTDAEVSDLLKPCLRLFMSVDVVDSTPIKQRTERTEDLNWIAQFGYFLALFPYELRASYEDEHSPKAGLWKSVGDELVFVADLRSAADAVRHVQAFLDAMANFARHQEVRELRFKATAWQRDFPWETSPCRWKNR